MKKIWKLKGPKQKEWWGRQGWGDCLVGRVFILHAWGPEFALQNSGQTGRGDPHF